MCAPSPTAPAGGSLVTSTNAARLTADASATEPGLYEATYIPRETGGYLAEAVVTDSTGAEVGRAEAGGRRIPAAEEFRSLRPNRALMEQIARQTGGQVIAADKLDDFAAGLPNRKAPVTEDLDVIRSGIVRRCFCLRWPVSSPSGACAAAKGMV